jgi:hypothetical protein
MRMNTLHSNTNTFIFRSVENGGVIEMDLEIFGGLDPLDYFLKGLMSLLLCTNKAFYLEPISGTPMCNCLYCSLVNFSQKCSKEGML